MKARLCHFRCQWRRLSRIYSADLSQPDTPLAEHDNGFRSANRHFTPCHDETYEMRAQTVFATTQVISPVSLHARFHGRRRKRCFTLVVTGMKMSSHASSLSYFPGQHITTPHASGSRCRPIRKEADRLSFILIYAAPFIFISLTKHFD